jgi:guanosine-3',5'-bis(diphosphate) 3'-pyrophosphohydrolase
MIFDLEVWDLKHLNGLIARLRDAEAVSTVERASG